MSVTGKRGHALNLLLTGMKRTGVGFVTLLIMIKVTVGMNKNSLDKCKMRLLVLEINFKFELYTSRKFKFQRSTGICLKGIRLTFDEFINSLRILKDSVDMNLNGKEKY